MHEHQNSKASFQLISYTYCGILTHPMINILSPSFHLDISNKCHLPIIGAPTMKSPFAHRGSYYPNVCTEDLQFVPIMFRAQMMGGGERKNREKYFYKKLVIF